MYEDKAWPKKAGYNRRINNVEMILDAVQGYPKEMESLTSKLERLWKQTPYLFVNLLLVLAVFLQP